MLQESLRQFLIWKFLIPYLYIRLIKLTFYLNRNYDQLFPKHKNLTITLYNFHTSSIKITKNNLKNTVPVLCQANISERILIYY